MLFRRCIAIFLAITGPGFSIFAQTIITSQPAGLTNVAIGQSVTFSVEASSPLTTVLRFQWKINGVNISGATNSTLEFTDIQPTNGGEISVVVTDGFTAVESAYVPLTFDVPFLAGKAFVNRLALTPIISGMIRSDNIAATSDPNDPVIVSDVPGGKGGKRIWFSWTPTNNGIATFKTLGSGFETVLGVYTGTALTNLVGVPSAVNDDDGAGNLNSRIQFNVVSNTEYGIAVDGYWGAYGNVLLSWNEKITTNFVPTFKSMPRPQIVISSGAAVNFGGHWDVGECDWFFNNQDTTLDTNTLYLTDIAPTNVGKYVMDVTADDGLDTTMARPARLELNALDDGTTTASSFAWPKFRDAASSPFIPTTSQIVTQPQDGGDTRGYSVSQTFSTVGNVSEPGEPTVCAQIPSHPCWYVYVTPTNGSMVIDTTGSSFDTVLGVFVGPGNSFGTLTNVGCGYTTNHTRDGQPQVFLSSVPPGQTNYIVVDGYNQAKGAVQLNLYVGNPVIVNSAPQDTAVAAGANAAFAIGATGSTPVSYLWEFNGKSLPNATNSTLTISNVLLTQAGTYTVTVSNPLSTTNVSATLSLAAQAPLRLAQPSWVGGAFDFQLIGLAGSNYIIQTSTNLTTWIPLLTNNATNGFLNFADSNAPAFPSRFYRAIAP